MYRPNPGHEYLMKIFCKIKYDMCMLAGQLEFGNFLKSSLFHQIMPTDMFYHLYLKHITNMDNEGCKKVLEKYMKKINQRLRGMLLKRGKQIIAEFAVLLMGPIHTREWQGDEMLRLIARFKCKNDTGMDLSAMQVFMAALKMDKHCFDIVMHWIHVSCKGRRNAGRANRVLHWVKQCLLTDTYAPVYINQTKLSTKHALILIHKHEELCRMMFSITDSVSYGSSITTISNNKTSIPSSILNKVMSQKSDNYLKHTSLYTMDPPENTRGLIVNAEPFTIVLHNGRFNHVSSNHINGLMQAMWEATGICYLEENTHKMLRVRHRVKDECVNTPPEKFIMRHSEMLNPDCVKMTPFPVVDKLMKFEPVDVVSEYELSQICSINDTMDFLLASIKDVTRYKAKK
uniref:ORF129 n=1 Tax=Malaco herpesvirus 1 TaxID=3031797 RepID=A0AA48P8E8_9VIRU|nr:TPA_asm: ORF129 [Malaco herpesvirus 1]